MWLLPQQFDCVAATLYFVWMTSWPALNKSFVIYLPLQILVQLLLNAICFVYSIIVMCQFMTLFAVDSVSHTMLMAGAHMQHFLRCRLG